MAHIHEVIDSDKCFTIDPITRLIVNDAGNKKTQLIQNDHNSERFAFQLPRYIEGHDMSLSNKVEVHYINLDQSSNERSVGVYEVNDLALSEDNESVLLSWLISNNATKYVGVLSFAICFKCMSDDVIDYSWNTAINSSIQIAKGMYNSEIIIKDYIDVLEAWKEEFMSSIDLSGSCLRAVDPIGTGSFSMNRAEGTDVGTNSVTLGTGCIASGQGCYAEGMLTIAGNYERLNVSTTISEQIDSKNMICLSIRFNKEVFPISVGDSITIIVGIVMDITTFNVEYKNIASIVQSITEPDPLAEIKEYKIYIDENEILNSGTDFETTQVFVILYKNQNQSSGEAGPMFNTGCHAEGSATTASGESSHAEGNNTTASGDRSHAEGSATTASGESSHAEGYSTTAIGYCSHSEGYSTEASGSYSHAEGYCTEASGDRSHAEGEGTTAVGDRSHAEGYYTTASGNSSHAEGYYTEASSTYSHAEGYYTEASGNYSHAEGGDTTASGNRSHAEGEGTTASGDNSHAEGYSTKASGSYSHAEGEYTKASGYSSHAEGYYNLSGGYTKFDAALGSETVDSTINYYIDVANLDTTLISTNDEIYVLVEDNASTEKQICKIIASSITEYNTTDEVSTVKHKIYFDENELKNQMSGFPNIKIINIYVKNNNNPYSTHAEGKYTTASGDSSHAEGRLTEASGSSSHAEGVYTMASGDYGSHAEGEYTTASGPVSHAEGYYTTASGDSSHAEGDHTTASGENSHAEGDHTTASGYSSHAEGEYTKASGKYAHAEGYHTTARSNSQHVQGKYNVEDTNGTYAHIVGGGTSNTDRKNIYTLDWNGNAVYSGDVNAKTLSINRKEGSTIGQNSVALGQDCTASGTMSHAEGYGATASGSYSHAEGYHTTASGSYSHAEGYMSKSSGGGAHSEGCSTNANYDGSHSEGSYTKADNYDAHAEGTNTVASGKRSHAEGYYTKASSDYQHVQGKYNVEDTNGTYAHIVGGGTSNTDRKNIHTLDWNGNAVYSGDVNATDSDGSTVSLLGTKWKLKGNVVNNNTISLPDNYTELKVMSYKTDQEYPIAYTQTILKDMIDVINKDTMQLYCGNTQQYGASWSINKSAKTIQLTNIENTTQVNNCATYLYYR